MVSRTVAANPVFSAAEENLMSVSTGANPARAANVLQCPLRSETLDLIEYHSDARNKYERTHALRCRLVDQGRRLQRFLWRCRRIGMARWEL
jgi:hypothetical protein